MPLYEFHCRKCGRESELLLPRPEWKGTTCPHCGSKQLEKKLSVFAATAAESTPTGPACTGNPGSCCRCGGGE